MRMAEGAAFARAVDDSPRGTRKGLFLDGEFYVGYATQSARVKCES